jgi:enterochelin esterase-like enzyme
MRRTLIIGAILALALPAFAAGTVENREMYSNALGENRWVQVYTPDGYDPGAVDPYPAVYFLHGANADYACCSELIAAADSLILAGLIEPIVLIKPDGSGCVYGMWNGCGWVNSVTQGNFEDFLIDDLIPWVESEYHVAPVRGMRAIMGHSMGGFGAMHTALRHPEMFLAVASHSSYLYFDDFDSVHRPLVLMEQTGSPPWTYTPSAGVFTGGWFLLGGGFSPNPSAPPYYVDFLIDPYGDIIPSVWDRWLEHDPAHLIQTIPVELLPEIYFDCGSVDELHMYPFNVDFDAFLTASGIPHDWRTYYGTHTSLIYKRVAKSLEWIDDMRLAATPADRLPQEETAGLLLTHRPNPVRGTTTFSFDLERQGHASLAIYDVRGRRVDTLLDEFVGGGRHRVLWNARGVCAGIYFCRLEVGSHTLSAKLVVTE